MESAAGARSSISMINGARRSVTKSITSGLCGLAAFLLTSHVLLCITVLLVIMPEYSLPDSKGRVKVCVSLLLCELRHTLHFYEIS